jgi:hypothetical protein
MKKYLFTKNSSEIEDIVKHLRDFFVENHNKKISFKDQDGYEHDPLEWIKLSNEPIRQRIGYTITDIYHGYVPNKVVNTVLQLYLGKYLPVGDKDAIWLGEGSEIEFSDKGFVITQPRDGDRIIQQLTVKVLGFENVSFAD